MRMALLRTLGVAVFPFVLTLQGCGNAGNAPSTPTPAPSTQLRTFGVRMLNPHNMPLVLDFTIRPYTSISWVEDTPGFPGENSTDGQSVNWVSHTMDRHGVQSANPFNFSGVGAAHGVMEFHCEDLRPRNPHGIPFANFSGVDARVAIGANLAYYCKGPSWDPVGSKPEDCPSGLGHHSMSGNAVLTMDFPHCNESSEPPSNLDGSPVTDAARGFCSNENDGPWCSGDDTDLFQLDHVDNEWVTFSIKNYLITRLPSHCNFDHCTDVLPPVTDTALAISV